MTKPILTLTADSPTEPTCSFQSGRNGPFSAVLRTANHQYSKGKTSHVCGSRVVSSQPSTPHPIHKLDNLIGRWLDEHQWIATRTRNAAAHLNRRWRDLSQEQKQKKAFEYAEAAGAHAFSLDLLKMVAKRAAAAPDPVKYLAKRLNGKLCKQGLSGLEYAFVFDVAKAGKLHIHGVFVLGQNDINLVKVALRNAGGRFSTGNVARQLSVSNLNAGLGFHRYIRKAHKSVSHVLSGKRLEFVSQTLNRATEAFHEANRPKKWRAQRNPMAMRTTEGPVESIAESPARLGLLGLLMLSCAPNALLRPSQSAPEARTAPTCRSERRRHWRLIPHGRSRGRITRSAPDNGWLTTTSHQLPATANRRLRNIGAVGAERTYQGTLHAMPSGIPPLSHTGRVAKASTTQGLARAGSP